MRERSCLGGFFALSPGILTAFPSSMKNSRSKAGQTLGDAKCLWLAPSSLDWSSRETQFPIEPQVLTPQHLGDVRDLPIVQSEMFHNLVNGLEPIDLVALNFKWREQIGFGQSGKDFGSLLHGSPKLLNEQRNGNTTLRLKFSRSVAAVFSLVKRCNQPLANVAVQVKDHIPNTVAGFVRTPPDLFVRQSLHTGSQTRPILFQQLIA